MQVANWHVELAQVARKGDGEDPRDAGGDGRVGKEQVVGRLVPTRVKGPVLA